MNSNRKIIRGKLLSYQDINTSLSHLDPVKDQEAYAVCIEKLAEINRLLNAIPAGSREYNAVRLKYIERKRWAQIERKLYLSNRACREAASKGLDFIAATFFLCQ